MRTTSVVLEVSVSHRGCLPPLHGAWECVTVSEAAPEGALVLVSVLVPVGSSEQPQAVDPAIIYELDSYRESMLSVVEQVCAEHARRRFRQVLA